AELLDRRLSVVGIDYEAAYVRKAEAVLRAEGLWRPAPADTEGYRQGEFYCHVLERSIYDNLSDLCFQVGDEAFTGEVPKEVPEEMRFDAVYFSGSFSVLPDPPEALRAVLPLMKRNGRVFITQTFQKRSSPVMAFLKPLLKYITTIDFGQLVTEADLERLISSAGCFEVLENKPIPGSVATHLQTARLVILKAPVPFHRAHLGLCCRFSSALLWPCWRPLDLLCFRAENWTLCPSGADSAETNHGREALEALMAQVSQVDTIHTAQLPSRRSV
ncbi:unnamed protein product, partial [Symbiodinium necroappetens]